MALSLDDLLALQAEGVDFVLHEEPAVHRTVGVRVSELVLQAACTHDLWRVG